MNKSSMMKKILISLFLSLSLALSNTLIPVKAANSNFVTVKGNLLTDEVVSIVGDPYLYNTGESYDVATKDEFVSKLNNAISNCEEQITLNYTGSNAIGSWPAFLSSALQDVLQSPGYEYEKILLSSYKYSYSNTQPTFTVTYQFTYLETAEQRQAVSDKVNEVLANIITDGMTDEQKEKAINDYIVLNIAYDTSLVQHSAYAGLFGNKKTVCQGYALLAYKMLTTSGIEARIVTGNAGGPHAWNLVKINGNWYHLDCTWNDPVPDVPNKVSYKYFNLQDDQLSSRTWDKTKYPAAVTPYVASDPAIIAGGRIVDLTGIALSTNFSYLNINDTKNLALSFTPTDAAIQAVIWKTSDSSVASVDTNGNVKGLKVGITTISAATKDGKFIDSCQVVVKNVWVDGVTITAPKNTVNVGDLLKLEANIRSDASNKAVVWQSSNTKAATIDTNGNVKGIAQGTSNITVTTADGKFVDTFQVIVVPVSVTGVALNLNTVNIEIGSSKALAATVAPANATNKSVKWESNNNSIATVDSNGNVKAVAIGTAEVKVTTIDGGKQSACNITVLARSKGLSLNKTITTIEKKSSETLTLSGNISDETIIWKTSNDKIATVDNGKIMVLDSSIGGNVTITASGSKSGTISCIVTVPNRVSSITIVSPPAKMNIGEKKQLTVSFNQVSVSNKNVSWTSSDDTIISVDNGKIIALKEGNAQITVTAEDGGKTASCSIIVSKVAVTSVAIPANISIQVGEAKTITAAISPAAATDKSVIWSTSDSSILSIDEKGVINGVKEGNVTIKATSVDGGIVGTGNVIVKSKLVLTNVKLDKTSLNIHQGESKSINTTITPINVSNKEIIWSSLDESIATVDSSGNIKGIAPGITGIIAKTYNGHIAMCEVIVDSAVTGISLNNNTLEMEAGNSKALVAAITPDNATIKDVTFTSSVQSVATVDVNGIVKAISAGNTVITATTVDGKYTSYCRIIVLPVRVEDVVLNETESLTIGQSKTLTPTFAPTTATNKNVTWTSSNGAIVSVDAKGNIKGLKAGNATITVTSVDGNYTSTCNITVVS